MRRSAAAAALWTACGLSTAADVSILGIVTPCPDCASGIAPPLLTITSQLQPVSTCIPEETCTSTTCYLEPFCFTYDWVSSTIPCLGGATSTLITSTDQIVELAHVSTVLTSCSPCTTTAPIWNETVAIITMDNCRSMSYQTMVVDLSAPFDECGPLALGNWEGSGLCKECTPNPDTEIQIVNLSKCLDEQCTSYAETWMSRKPTATSTSECPTPVLTSTYCSENGVYTIPITQTFTPTGQAFSDPVTTTVSYTTSVADAPKNIVCKTTITLTFSSTECPFKTFVSGT